MISTEACNSVAVARARTGSESSYGGRVHRRQMRAETCSAVLRGACSIRPGSCAVSGTQQRFTQQPAQPTCAVNASSCSPLACSQAASQGCGGASLRRASAHSVLHMPSGEAAGSAASQAARKSSAKSWLGLAYSLAAEWMMSVSSLLEHLEGCGGGR